MAEALVLFRELDIKGVVLLEKVVDKNTSETLTGVEVEINALARGEWKSRGMSRIFAHVVRRANGYLNLFCQLYVPTNESNY